MVQDVLSWKVSKLQKGASEASPGRKKQKKPSLKPGLLYTEKTSSTNKMFAFLGKLKAVSDPDEAMQGKTKKLTVSLGRHEFLLFVQQQLSHFKELNGSYG